MTDVNKSNIKECEICYQTELTKNNTIILPCNHDLCKKCCKLLMNDKCPFCRNPFNKNTYFQINIISTSIPINYNIIVEYHDYEYEEIHRQRELRIIREKIFEINQEQRKKNFDKKYKYILSKIYKNNIRNIRKNHFRNNSAILLY